MNQAILISILTVIGSIVVSIVAASGVIAKNRTDAQTARGNLEHTIREELRKDREDARKDAKEARDEADKERNELNQKIEQLRQEIQELKTAVDTHKVEKEAALADAAKSKREAEKYKGEAENARTEADGWKAKYQAEHDTLSAVTTLYEAVAGVHKPDAGLIASAEETLRRTGFLSGRSSIFAVTSAPPAPPAPLDTTS